jgi:hypothetical protein
MLCKRPIKDLLIDDLVNLHTFVKIGMKYNVSDKTIRDWCDFYSIDYKSLVTRKKIDKSLKKNYINNMNTLQQQQQTTGEATPLV